MTDDTDALVAWYVRVEGARDEWPGCLVDIVADGAALRVGVSLSRLNVSAEVAAATGLEFAPTSYLAADIALDGLKTYPSTCGQVVRGAMTPVTLSWWLADRMQRAVTKAELAPEHVIHAALTVIEFGFHALRATCVVCGSALPGVALKPRVCDDAMCQMKHERLGVCMNVLAEMRLQPDVSALLVKAAQACAAAKARAPLGFPADLSYKLLAELPPPAALVAAYSTLDELQKALTPPMYRTLRWVFASHKGTLTPVPAELLLPINAPRQYVVTTPDRDAAFAAAAAGGDTMLAWHGSAFCNWHAILRSGLRVLSNTSFMTNGAASGAGIYLARDGTVSLQYSAQYSGSTSLIAICEFKARPEARNRFTGVYVIDKEEDVTIRMVLEVSPSTTLGDVTLLKDAVKRAYTALTVDATSVYT
jgi:hypothetical protein